MLTALQKTIEAVENSDYDKFDALVCENLCQIRAPMVHLICRECLESLIKIKDDILYILDKVKNLNSKNQINFHELEIHLSGNQLFLVKLYLLTVVKKQNCEFPVDEETDLNLINLMTGKNFTNSFLNKLINKIRIQISAISAPFLRRIAELSGDTFSLKMFEKHYVIPINKRDCPPTYWATKMFMQAMLIYRIPVVLWVQQRTTEVEGYKIIREVAVYYESDPSQMKFIRKDPLFDSNKPVMVVKGATIRPKTLREISLLQSFDLKEFCSCMGPFTRQYPNEKDRHVDDTSDVSYHQYKKKQLS